MSKSSLMVAYNTARTMVNDQGRLNRGFGLAQRKDTTTEYVTTVTSCTCKDFYYRGRAVGSCKHMLSLALSQASE